MLWKRENVLKGKVPNKSGIYNFYDRSGRLIYTGHSQRLRHRLQSYYQNDDLRVHRTKTDLRGVIGSFSYTCMPVSKAKKIEKKLKKNSVFNFR